MLHTRWKNEDMNWESTPAKRRAVIEHPFVREGHDVFVLENAFNCNNLCELRESNHDGYH